MKNNIILSPVSLNQKAHAMVRVGVLFCT